MDKKNPITVREACFSDREALRRLAGQLGYDSSEAEFEKRLVVALAGGTEGRGAIFVAETGGDILGWTSVHSSESFYSEPFAEVSGLVTDSGARGRGVGTALLDRASAWASERGFGTLRLRMNALRTESHKFYLARGFTEKKRQVVFERPVEAAEPVSVPVASAVAAAPWAERSLSEGFFVRALSPRDAPSLFALLERERERLSRRLAFIAGMKTVRDVERMLVIFAGKAAKGDGLMWGMFSRPGAGESGAAESGATGAAGEARMLGTITVSQVDRAILCAECAYLIDAEHEGMGLVGRAFDLLLDHIFTVMKLEKALVCCQPDNARSAALPLRRGFVREGVIRNGFRLRGNFVDVDMYGLLRNEYYSLQCRSKDGA